MDKDLLRKHAKAILDHVVPGIDYSRVELTIAQKAGRPHLITVKPYQSVKANKIQVLERIADELARTQRKLSNGRAEDTFAVDYDQFGNISSFSFLVTERIFLDER